MKNTIRLAAAAFAALAALACSKDDAATPETGNPGTPDRTAPFTITASIDTPADTRISMTDDDALRAIDLKWKTGDKIYVVNGDGPSETVYPFTATTVAADGKTAAFTAPDGYSGTPMYAMHKGTDRYSSFNPKNVNKTGNFYDDNISSLPNGFPLYGKYDEATRRISFKPLFALLKLAVTLPPEATGSFGNLRIASVSGDAIFYSSNYDITGESPVRAGSYMTSNVSYLGYGSYTAGTTANLYISIHPGAELSNQKIEIDLFVGAYIYYTTITGGNLEAGKCYPLTLPAGKWSGGKIYEGGSGASADNPYQIKNEINLRSLAKAVSVGSYFSGKYFRLENSISGIVTSPENPWLPIGASGITFNGNFDGNNCSIGGTFHLSDKDGSYLGFFGYIDNGSVSNLTIDGDIIYTGDSDKSSIKIGGIAGYSSSPLSRCSHTGALTVENAAFTKTVYAGGIVGEASYGVVGCTQSGGTITVNTPNASTRVGGVCGYFSSPSASMHTSRNESSIGVTGKNSSNNYVGALVGLNNGTVYSCSTFLDGPDGITITVNTEPQNPVKAIGDGSSGHTELDTTEHTEPAQ